MKGLELFSFNSTELNMITSGWFFFLTCLVLGETAQTSDAHMYYVHQEERFVSVKAGDDLSLRCSYKPDVGTRFYWYKQILGQRPRQISSLYSYNQKPTFYDEFSKNPHFRADKHHLNISNVNISDAGIYYCASSFSFDFDVGDGATVSVEGSNVNLRASVHQSGADKVHPGASVTLNCTVQTGTCDGEHSVYWFKKSEDAQPGVIYTHGGRNEQCGKKNEPQTHTCVYNLPIQNVNYTHAGTYYCAVLSCGRITIGNGTNMEFKEESLVLVYFLSGALGLMTVLLIVLSFSLYKMKSKNNVQFPESQSRYEANTEVYPDAHNVHYAAVSVRAPNSLRRQTNTTSNECVYSSLKK